MTWCNYRIDWPYKQGDIVECFDYKTKRTLNKYLILSQAGVMYSRTHNWYNYSVLVLMEEFDDKIHPYKKTVDLHGMSLNFLTAYGESSQYLHEYATRIHSDLHIFGKAL